MYCSRKAVPADGVDCLEHDKTLRSPDHPLQQGESPVVTVFRASQSRFFLPTERDCPCATALPLKTTLRTGVRASQLFDY